MQKRWLTDLASPAVVAYHFTRKTNADSIRSQGFRPSEEMFGNPVVWLTRNPDDLTAGKRGSVRLTVTVAANRWLVASAGMIRSKIARRRTPQEREAFLRVLDKHADETLDEFVHRKGYAGLWYSDPAQPWLAVIDPHAVTLLDD